MSTPAYQSWKHNQVLLKKLHSVGWRGCLRGLHGPPKTGEYNSVAVYPAIPGHATKDQALRHQLKENIKQLKTVEEKQFAINRPKYYGWYSSIIDSDFIPPDALDFVQFATWTTKIEGLPEVYSNTELTAAASKALESIGPQVEQAIISQTIHHEHGFNVKNDFLPMRDSRATGYYPDLDKSTYLKKSQSDVLVKKIHEIIMSNLEQSEHLRNCTQDIQPRNEAFWFRGGIQPDKGMIRKRFGNQKAINKLIKQGSDREKMTDAQVNEVYERAVQINSYPVLQMRGDHPLPPFVARDSIIATDTSQVPIFTYDPRTLGIQAKCQHGTNIPGYWPEDQHQHGLLSYTNTFNRYTNSAVCSKNVENQETLRKQNIAKAILTGFGWLLPQAVHLGFSPLTDLTYPLSTQTVVTDGRLWTFSSYQINTTDLSINKPEEHTHSNVCWVDSEKCLYDRATAGSVEGYNPSALLPLVKMCLLQPQSRTHNMTPYLEGEGRLANHSDNYQRQFLHEEVQRQHSNRPRHYPKPEKYAWEKIYMIDNDTMHMHGVRRGRWFQMYKISHLGKEHFHPEFKQYDEVKHRYLPRAFRERWETRPGLGRRYSRKLPKLRVPLEEAPGPFPAQILEDSPVDYSNPSRPVTKITIGPRDGKTARP